MPRTGESDERAVGIPADSVSLEGTMVVPAGTQGIVLFAHGSGSSRHSPRNRAVARDLQQAGLATLLVDLLSAEEEVAERYTRHLRFDIPLLARRLVAATAWLARQPQTAALKSATSVPAQARAQPCSPPESAGTSLPWSRAVVAPTWQTPR